MILSNAPRTESLECSPPRRTRNQLGTKASTPLPPPPLYASAPIRRQSSSARRRINVAVRGSHPTLKAPAQLISLCELGRTDINMRNATDVVFPRVKRAMGGSSSLPLSYK